MKYKNNAIKEFFLGIGIFLSSLLVISFFYKNNLMLTVLVIIITLTYFKFLYKNHDIFLFLTGTAIGVCGEIVFIHFGAWQYTNPSFLGVPLWLPFAWGFTVMVIRNIAESLAEISK